MPNWKKVIVSGSDASLSSLLVSSSIAVGTSSLGSTENTLVIGLPPAGGAGEGGQLLLQAPNSGGYTSASMLDNWQNYTRLLRGTNVSSVAVVTQWNMHTSQIAFPAYNSVSAFAGTAVANLAVDSSGNIITVSTSGGSVFPYTGVAAINGGLVVTGSITASGAIHAQANGAMYFRGGDDAEFWDINTVNTVGIYGQQDQGVASIKLGSGGGTISGRSGSIGIGTTTPDSASLTVNGNVWATSFTGSLQGTSSWATNALTASSADNFTVRNTLTAQTLVVQTITSSVDFVTGSTRFGSLISNTHLFTGSVGITGSLNVNGPIGPITISGNNVGIGVTSPLDRLHVALTNNQYAYFGGNDTTAGVIRGIRFGYGEAGPLYWKSAIIQEQTGDAAARGKIHILNNNQAGSNNASLSDARLTILASGEIGINNQSPAFTLDVSGSARFTNNVTVTGSIVATSFTGSLLGTASTASFVLTAQTASYVLQAVSASFATSASQAITASFANNADLLDGAHLSILATTGSNTFNGSQTITGSLRVTGSATLTGSLNILGTVSASSYSGSLLGTASFATSASWAPGGGASFPYTGSAVITGSLVLTGSFDIGPAEFNATSSATTAGTTIVSTYATGSANSAFYNYYISSGSNARAGQIMSVWSGSTIQYSEVTTNDIGNTNTASFAVTLATGNVRLSFTAPGVWTVRSIVNLL